MFETARGHLLPAIFAMALAGCAAGAPPPAPCPLPQPRAGPSLLIANADLNRAPRPVDAAQAIADLDVALRVFDEAYAGLDDAPRLPSPTAIAAARRTLAAQRFWTPAALAEQLRALLARPDGHLTFSYGPLHLYAIPSSPAPSRPDRLSSPRSAAKAPAYVAPDETFESAATTLGHEAFEPHQDPVHLSEGPIPVLAIRTFDPASRPALAALPDIARDLRRRRAFVVDLRGNGGGDYALAEAFLLALTDRPLHRLDEREVRSAAASEGRANSARRRLAAGDVPPRARPVFDAHIAAREAEARALRDAGAPRAEIISRGVFVPGRADGPLLGRAVFLVDRGCASACEMMVSLARQIPGVIIAGEPTRGSMAVGELALFRLPASGVTISLGTRAFHDASGAFAETRGFLPDVPLEGGDLLAKARRLARGSPPAP